MQPKRIQLSRRKGWRMPPNTVKVARPTKYGNPHRVGLCHECGVSHTRDEAIAEFRALCDEPEIRDRIRRHLAGKNLACWCKTEDGCHADVLLEIANTGPTTHNAGVKRRTAFPRVRLDDGLGRPTAATIVAIGLLKR